MLCSLISERKNEEEKQDCDVHNSCDQSLQFMQKLSHFTKLGQLEPPSMHILDDECFLLSTSCIWSICKIMWQEKFATFLAFALLSLTAFKVSQYFISALRKKIATRVKCLGIGLGKIWYRKKVLEPVLEKFCIGPNFRRPNFEILKI